MDLICEFEPEMDVIKYIYIYISSRKVQNRRYVLDGLLYFYLENSFYFSYSLCGFIHSLSFCKTDEELKESQIKNPFPIHQGSIL